MRVLGLASLTQWLRVLTTNQGEQNCELVDASIMDYAPGTPANWGPAPPTTIGGGLDQMSAPGLSQQSCGALGPAAAVQFDSSPITMTKSGIQHVTISGTFTSSAAATITVTERVDSITNQTFGTFTATAGQVVPFSFTKVQSGFVGTHTVGFGISASAGNVSVAASAVQVTVLEVGG